MEEIKKEKITATAWYFRTWVIAVAIFSFGPLGLVLLWFRPKTNVYIKLLISLLVVVLTLLMVKTTVKYYQQISAYYNELYQINTTK